MLELFRVCLVLVDLDVFFEHRTHHTPMFQRSCTVQTEHDLLTIGQVARLLPLHLHHTLVLCCMLQELVDKLGRLRKVKTFSMVDVCRKTQIHPARTLAEFGRLVAAHGIIRGLDVGEVLWSCRLLRIQDGVRDNIIVSQQASLDVSVEVVKSSACVCEGGAATRSRWRELVRQQQGVSASSRIEAGIDVKQGISLEQAVSVCFKLANGPKIKGELPCLPDRWRYWDQRWSHLVRYC